MNASKITEQEKSGTLTREKEKRILYLEKCIKAEKDNIVFLRAMRETPRIRSDIFTSKQEIAKWELELYDIQNN